MYNSIASVELVSNMKPQFADIFPVDDHRESVTHGPARRLLVAALHALANRLDPAR